MTTNKAGGESRWKVCVCFFCENYTGPVEMTDHAT